MARKSEGWSLSRDKRTGKYIVRLRHGGRQRTRSTRTQDLAEAKRRAADIYEEVVHGRRRQPRSIAPEPLDVLAAKWLATLHPPSPDETTIEMYESHMQVHLIPSFRTLDRVTKREIEEYVEKALTRRTRSSICKELSTLRRFMRWATRKGYVDEPPDIKNPPKEQRGTP